MTTANLTAPHRISRSTNWISQAALAVLCLIGSFAQRALAANPPMRVFDVPATEAETALPLFSQQAGQQLIYMVDSVRGEKTNAVKGEFTPRDALEQMLNGTRLAITQDRLTGALAIRRKQTSENPEKVGPREDEAPLVLSPFEVKTDSDVGYLAANTLSGGRLNTLLLDTPASISEMTAEFLADIGANNVMDAVEYSLGFQAERPGSNDNVIQFTPQPAVARGIGRSGTTTRDFFSWEMSSDSFSIERLSFSRGPNSIINGIGNPGGLINIMSKRANFRTFTELVYKIDDNGGWRAQLDHNHKLNDSLAVRVNLLKEDAKTWRELEYTRQERMHVAGTWRVAKRTELRADFERGIQERLIGMRFAPRDNFTPWIAAGSPVYDRVAHGDTYPDGTVPLSTAAPRLTYDGDARQWLNWQRFATSKANTLDFSLGLKMQDETYVPFSNVLLGPSSTSDNDGWTYSAFLQHELVKNLFVEIAINEQGTERVVNRAMVHSFIALNIDPNKTLPDGRANPNFGKFYVEGPAFLNPSEVSTFNKRVLATYEWDTKNKWLGTHRWMVFGQSEKSKLRGRQYNEVNLTPLNPAVPAYSNAANSIQRRTYLDFNGGNRYYNQDPFRSTQASVPFSDPVNGLSGTITPGFYLSNDNPRRSTTESMMVAGQSKFWTDRLAVTYGFRRDTADRRESTLVRDPRTLAVIDAPLGPVTSYKGNTRTLGAVLHVTKAWSLYANTSDNFTPQSGLDPNGNNINNVKGRGREYGLKFNLDRNRIYARAGYYESAAENQLVLPFRYLRPALTIWEALEGITGPHAARIGGTGITARDTQSVKADGYEFEVTANLIKGLSFNANYALLRSRSEDLFPITRAYVAQFRPLWLENSDVPTRGSRTVATEIAAIDEEELSTKSRDGRESTGNYRHSINFFGRYQFQNEALKGWSLGGGARYRAGRVIGFTAESETVRAPKSVLVDANLAYRRKIYNNKVEMRLQLNVANALNNRDLIWTSIHPTTYLKNDYSLFTPRLYTLTATFSYR